jgi:hypothetical protein
MWSTGGSGVLGGRLLGLAPRQATLLETEHRV